MIRFIHTADWQMGAKFTNFGELAPHIREVRGTTARRIVQLADDRNADFLLIAGDLFEDHTVGSETIDRVLDALRETSIPVLVLPGNHDPLRPGGVWDRRRWQEGPENIQLLKEQAPVILEQAVLYACPLRQKRSRRDPTKWIPEKDEHCARHVRVGVAHGSLDILGKDVNFPVAPERAYEASLDYLALGDWHSVYQHNDRTFYSGTPEPTSFDERDPGQVLEVEIAGPGAVPEVRRHRVNCLTWIAREHDVSSDPEMTELEQWISELQTPESMLLRLRLDGVVDLECAQRATQTAQELSRDLYHLVVEDALQTAPSEEDLASQFPSGPVGRAAEDLLHITTGRVPSGPGREFADSDPEVVRRALQLLYAAVREVET